jgi:rhamnosyltransferase
LKIAAYITAYREEDAVVSTIQALLGQSLKIDQILILDNSPEALQLGPKSDSIIVRHCPENIGTAGGLAWAVTWVIAADYDFIWTLDQDSQLSPTLLEGLITKYKQLQALGTKVGVIAPKIVDVNTRREFPGVSFDQYRFVNCPDSQTTESTYCCDAVITSGSLVSIAAARHVPLPNPGYFLDAVDYAYCMEFRRAGYQVVICKRLALRHRLGSYEETQDRLEGKPARTFLCQPSRYYYACRGHSYLELQMAGEGSAPQAIAHRYKTLLWFIEHIIRHEPDQVEEKIAACTSGTRDGLAGKLGGTWANPKHSKSFAAPATAPAVALVVPVFNRKEYLSEALESIKAQSFEDFELVIWDDGSTDGAGEIARAFAEQDSRFRYFRTKQNRGIPAALKSAIAKTSAPYFGWVDSDDILGQTALTKTKAVLDQLESVGCVYTKYQPIDAQGGLLEDERRASIPYSSRGLLTNFMAYHFRLIRRTVYDAVGGIDARFSFTPDYDLCLKLSEVSDFFHLPERLYSYRIHDKRASSLWRLEQIANAQLAVEEALERRGMAEDVRLEVEVTGERSRFRLVKNQ